MKNQYDDRRTTAVGSDMGDDGSHNRGVEVGAGRGVCPLCGETMLLAPTAIGAAKDHLRYCCPNSNCLGLLRSNSVGIVAQLNGSTAEIKRLRSALTKIADYDTWTIDLRGVALEALEFDNTPRAKNRTVACGHEWLDGGVVQHCPKCRTVRATPAGGG